MPNMSELKNVTTESEIGSNGVGHSKMQGNAGEGMASPAELTAAIEAQQKTIEALSKELAEAKQNSKSDSDINKLAEAITSLVGNKKVEAHGHSENLNKTTDFSQRTLVDGKGLLAAQESLNYYKSEKKIPISIPKSFAKQFGPSLPISVNGVRVSIPCDGITYYINETHAEAAKERMAKVDRLLADSEPQIIETNA